MHPTTSQLTARAMARYIDHTLLKPDAATPAFDTLCEEALTHGFKAVCVNSGRLAQVVSKLRGSPVAACAVVGFPLGAMETEAKAFEAQRAVALGAAELDMVLNIGALKAGEFDLVAGDIRAVRQAAGEATVLKVIIETCLLSDTEKVSACEIAQAAGADFVKTSTGFSAGGATLEDVALMRRTVGPGMGVKASGGIKDFATAAALLAAGASRIGAGAGVAIIRGAPPG